MKNTNKIIKGTATLIFAALMVTSFGGCAKSESSSTTASSKTASSAVSTVEQSAASTGTSVQLVEAKDEAYTILDDGKNVGIYGFSDEGNLCNIPSTYKGKDVTMIEPKSFMGTSVVQANIPETITYIGEMAFYGCDSLEKVTMSSGVETIDESTFNNCTALKEITLSDALKEIESYVFMGCTSLEKVTLGANVEKIDETSFAGCTALKEVHMGNSVTYIAGQDVDNPAFKNCNNMTIYAPAGSYAESFAKENNIPFVAE